jgi:hypothetical protein
LVAAKVLFLIAFVSLPILICQWVPLVENGKAPLHWLIGLLWRQLFFAIFVILPAVALAAVTSNLAQVLLCVVLSCTALFAAPFSSWGDYAWIQTSVIAIVVLAGVSATVILQYTRRKTPVARVMVAITFALAVAIAGVQPFGTVFAVQRIFSLQTIPANAVSLSIDASAVAFRPEPSQVGAASLDPYVQLAIPLRVSKLPSGLRLDGDLISVTLGAPGAVWHSHWVRAGFFHPLSGDTIQVDFGVNRKFYERWKDAPIHLSATANLSLSVHVSDVPYWKGCVVAEPGGSWCGDIDGRGQLMCTSPYLGLALTLQQGDPPRRSEFSLYKPFGPFPTGIGFRPFQSLRSPADYGATRLSFDRPVAYIQRRIEASAIHLRDFAAE